MVYYKAYLQNDFDDPTFLLPICSKFWMLQYFCTNILKCLIRYLYQTSEVFFGVLNIAFSFSFHFCVSCFYEAHRHCYRVSVSKNKKMVVWYVRLLFRANQKLTRLFHTELKILNIQSGQHQQSEWQLTTGLSPLVSAVQANCINLFFVVCGIQGSQHSIRTAATKRRQITTCQSPLTSAIHAN